MNQQHESILQSAASNSLQLIELIFPGYLLQTPDLAALLTNEPLGALTSDPRLEDMVLYYPCLPLTNDIMFDKFDAKQYVWIYDRRPRERLSKAEVIAKQESRKHTIMNSSAVGLVGPKDQVGLDLPDFRQFFYVCISEQGKYVPVTKTIVQTLLVEPVYRAVVRDSSLPSAETQPQLFEEAIRTLTQRVKHRTLLRSSTFDGKSRRVPVLPPWIFDFDADNCVVDTSILCAHDNGDNIVPPQLTNAQWLHSLGVLHDSLPKIDDEPKIEILPDAQKSVQLEHKTPPAPNKDKQHSQAMSAKPEASRSKTQYAGKACSNQKSITDCGMKPMKRLSDEDIKEKALAEVAKLDQEIEEKEKELKSTNDGNKKRALRTVLAELNNKRDEYDEAPIQTYKEQHPEEFDIFKALSAPIAIDKNGQAPQAHAMEVDEEEAAEEATAETIDEMDIEMKRLDDAIESTKTTIDELRERLEKAHRLAQKDKVKGTDFVVKIGKFIAEKQKKLKALEQKRDAMLAVDDERDVAELAEEDKRDNTFIAQLKKFDPTARKTVDGYVTRDGDRFIDDSGQQCDDDDDYDPEAEKGEDEEDELEHNSDVPDEDEEEEDAFQRHRRKHRAERNKPQHERLPKLKELHAEQPKSPTEEASEVQFDDDDESTHVDVQAHDSDEEKRDEEPDPDAVEEEANVLPAATESQEQEDTDAVALASLKETKVKSAASARSSRSRASVPEDEPAETDGAGDAEAVDSLHGYIEVNRDSKPKPQTVVSVIEGTTPKGASGPRSKMTKAEGVIPFARNTNISITMAQLEKSDSDRKRSHEQASDDDDSEEDTIDMDVSGSIDAANPAWTAKKQGSGDAANGKSKGKKAPQAKKDEDGKSARKIPLAERDTSNMTREELQQHNKKMAAAEKRRQSRLAKQAEPADQSQEEKEPAKHHSKKRKHEGKHDTEDSAGHAQKSAKTKSKKNSIFLSASSTDQNEMWRNQFIEFVGEVGSKSVERDMNVLDSDVYFAQCRDRASVELIAAEYKQDADALKQNYRAFVDWLTSDKHPEKPFINALMEPAESLHVRDFIRVWYWTNGVLEFPECVAKHSKLNFGRPNPTPRRMAVDASKVYAI